MIAKTVLATALTLAVATLLTVGTPVQAQSPPHVFVGEATLDAAAVPDGTVIAAVVNGQALPKSETIVRDGKFTLIVEQPEGVGEADAAIGFAVGDFLAQQTYPWTLGEITVVTLTATTGLPPIVAEIDPYLPERLLSGEEFLLTVKASTGFYKATRGEIRASIDPEIFSPDLDNLPHLAGRTSRAFLQENEVIGGWTYHTPTSTDVYGGELFSLPLRVRDTAPTRTTSLSIEVQVFGSDGESFPVEPRQLSGEVTVVGQASDLNEDGSVDFADLAVLGWVWGRRQGELGFNANYDLDGDGTIWIGDLVTLLQSFGATSQS